MPKKPTFWTPDRIADAKRVVEEGVAIGRRYREIASDLSQRWGEEVSRAKLDTFIQRFCKTSVPEADARDTIPAMAPAEEVPDIEIPEAPSPHIPEAFGKGKIHVVIPDTQVSPGVPTKHLGWIGRYLVDQFAGEDLTIIHLGDHWDMPSLSSYDKGTAKMEGRRYRRDINAGNDAWALLNAPLLEEEKRSGWRPVKKILRGNHEDRITRAANIDAQLLGTISLADLDVQDWEVHPFLEPVFLDGVGYSHYWYQPLTGKPYGGMIETRLKNIGHSFTMGHQQTLMYGVRYVGGISQHGLVCGSCYLHDEDYKGPQGNSHWRGIIVKHRVFGGSYDPMFVSLDYLRARYET